jgi:WD40 repeat protein
VGPAVAEPRRTTPVRPPSRPTPSPATRPALGAGTFGRVRKLWDAAVGGRARAVAVSSRLGRVAYSSGNGVVLYELSGGRQLATVAAPTDVVRGGLAFAEGMLVVVTEQSVQAFQGTRPVKLPVRIHESRITAAHLSFPRLAAGHNDGVIRIYGLDGSSTVEIPVPGPPIDSKSLALTRDGTRVAVAWIQGSVWWWDLARPGEFHDLVRHKSESDSLAFSDDGQLLAEEGETNYTTVWNTRGTPAPLYKLRNGAWVKRMFFTRDAKWLVRGGSDGLELCEVAGPRRVALDTRGAVEDIGLDEQGALLVAADRDGRLTVWGVGA